MFSKTLPSRFVVIQILKYTLTHMEKSQSTATRSAIGTVRESELYGGVLSSSLGREHLALTAEFLRGDE